MNALQSLTGGPAAGAAGLGLPARGPGQALGGMGGLGAMGQPVPLSGQPPPGASGMAPHSMAVVSTAAPQSEYTGGAGAVQPLPAGGGRGGRPGAPAPGPCSASGLLRPSPPGAAVGSRTGLAPGLGEQGEGLHCAPGPLEGAEEPSPACPSPSSPP